MKRKPPDDYYQLLSLYVGESSSREQVNTLRQKNVDFQSAKEILMKEDDKMIVKRRFERIYNAIESMADTKYEDIPENKEVIVYGFKHNKKDKVANYLLIGDGLDELYEDDKLFNFWSNKFLNKEIEKKDFKITGWPFITLSKRNNFFTVQSVCFYTHSHK